MDIEGPDSPIRSIRDFAIHIATVTIGILIALGLEALIEAHRNHELVEHTRADFRAEFAANRAAVVADLKRTVAVKTELEGLIGYGQARLAGKDAPLPTLSTTRAFSFLTTTSWETAVATQALIHMPFAEARQISATQAKTGRAQRHAKSRRGRMVRPRRLRRPPNGSPERTSPGPWKR